MNKLGVFVGERGLWTFFRDIYADLAVHYHINIFTPKEYHLPLLSGRVNNWAYQYAIHTILQQSDVCFFEWAGELLMHASNMPKRCAIVTRLHSFELYEWAPKINWQVVDIIILVSQAMQKKFTDLYPDQAAKTVVIYNGVSLTKFKPSHNKDFCFRIGMLCNLLPIKRVYEMILAFNAIRKAKINASLHIAGNLEVDKRYTAAIQRLIEKLNLQNTVILEGFIVDTPIWLRNIDIFVSNSFWEGQQVALIEAMASGCYCLSHFWDGAGEILPIENLYITEGELQNKIIDYASKSYVEQQNLCMILREIVVKEFNIEKTKEKIREVINEVGNKFHT